MGRTRWVATGVTGVAVAGLAFGAGYAAGRPDAHPTVAPRVLAAGTEPVPVGLAGGDLRAATSCDDLLDGYVDRALDLVGPWGWGGGEVYAAAEDSAALGEREFASAPVPTVDRAESGSTGTNVQEVGVDEPDVVKTDGRILVRVQDDLLTTYSLAGDRPTLLDSLDLPGVRDAEILLAGDTVVALGADPSIDGPSDPFTGERHGTRIVVVDVSAPDAMRVTDETGIDAGLVTARLHGSVVRVVLGNDLPRLDFVQPDGDRGERSAEEHNRDLVRATTLADWLPETGGDLLVDCTRVAVPDEDETLGTLTLMGFDAADPATWDTAAVATGSRTTYFSADRMVLASAPMWGGWGCCFDVRMPWGSGSSDDGATRLHSFALAGTGASYVASGQVDGSVADRWAMDESGGVLRLAVGPTSATGNFNSVVTLTESGDRLVEAGRVDKLGVGEQIKSVRWFDDLAIVVTFQQTDPLYAVDLTTSSPTLMGELKIPGFSEYLHPLGSHRMIGMGQDASLRGVTRGAQAAVYDVHDLTSPRQLDVVRYGRDMQALAGVDPRQFTWLPDQRTALTVLADGWEARTGYVSVLTLADGLLSNRMVEVEYGDDVAQVRLVPLPDGRVVLTTGDAVSFFRL